MRTKSLRSRPQQTRGLVLLAWLLFSAAIVSCEAPDSRLNVLLIVVDTLRADRLGCYGAERETSPGMDDLARRSVRFESAYVSAPWTMPSMASILTGLYPSKHGVTNVRRKLSDDVLPLAVRFSREGYRTAAVVSHRLVGSEKGFARGFGTFLEDEALGKDHISTPGVTRQALAELRQSAASGDPFFLMLHYFDPHYNYRAHANVDFAATAAGRLDGTQDIEDLRLLEGITDDEIQFLRDLYDEEIRFTDDGISQVIRALDELDLSDRTLVVITADHGEAFFEHGWLGHTVNLYDEVMRVPWIVLDPSSAGEASTTIREPVSLVAAAPTILELAGVPIDRREFQAPSLAGVVRGTSDELPETVFFEVDFEPVNPNRAVKQARQHGLVRGKHKIIRDSLRDSWELYDLQSDESELVNLVDDGVELFGRLRKELSAVRSLAALDPAEIEEESLSDDLRSTLEGLGYVGSSPDGD